MKYEIDNPFDKCYIRSESEQLAKVACILLGGGWYGLKDEQGKVVMRGRNITTQDVYEAADITPNDFWIFEHQFASELAVVFESFEYDGADPRICQMKAKAARYAAGAKRRAEQ